MKNSEFFFKQNQEEQTAYFTQMPAEDFLSRQADDRISKKIRLYCRRDGRANSGDGVLVARFNQISRWKRPGPGRLLKQEESFKGRRNKSELSGRPLRGEQLLCELQFQRLICSHNKRGIILRRGNLRSSFHPNPPTHTHARTHTHPKNSILNQRPPRYSR